MDRLIRVFKLIALAVAVFFTIYVVQINTANAARTDGVWEVGPTGTYIRTILNGGYDLLINGTSKYINFNTTVGSSGYGFRDNAGTIQWKNSGGSWANIGSGGGGGGYTNLTEFIDQTAWRLFYSDASGDVQELALGADGTYLRSNGASSAPTFDTPSGGSGDIEAVGDCTTGSCFTGSSGTTLTFDDADGDKIFKYDTTNNRFDIDAPLAFGTSGVRASGASGVLTLLGLSGTAEDLTIGFQNNNIINVGSSTSVANIMLNNSIGLGGGGGLWNLSGSSSSYFGNGAGGQLRTGFGGVTSPSAKIHIGAGATGALTAPLKFTSGSLMTTPEAGAVEFLTDDLYYTDSTPTRRTVANLDASQTFTNKTLGSTALTGAFTGTGNYLPVSLFNSGTSASSSTFWRGDGTWATPAGGGGGIDNVVEDTTPELGGDLDADGFDIVNLGTLNTHTVPGGTGTLALTSNINNIDETQLDASVNASLDLADTAVQPNTTPTLTGIDISPTGGNITGLGTVNLDVLKARRSAGIFLQSLSATNIGLFGAGDSANATWYGTQTHDLATASRLAIFDASKVLVSADTATYPSLTELSYVKGVTSAIQTQFTSKLDASAYDDADTSEVNTGTSTTKYVSPDSLAGSYAGSKPASITAMLPNESLAVIDGVAYMVIPAELNGMNLVDAQATIMVTSSSGDPQFDISRGRQASATTAHAYVDMLSTNITIDATEYDSKDDATQRVIDTSNDDVLTGDIIRFDIDGAGTGAKGLIFRLTFRLP